MRAEVVRQTAPMRLISWKGTDELLTFPAETRK